MIHISLFRKFCFKSGIARIIMNISGIFNISLEPFMVRLAFLSGGFVVQQDETLRLTPWSFLLKSFYVCSVCHSIWLRVKCLTICYGVLKRYDFWIPEDNFYQCHPDGRTLNFEFVVGENGCFQFIKSTFAFQRWTQIPLSVKISVSSPILS